MIVAGACLTTLCLALALAAQGAPQSNPEAFPQVRVLPVDEAEQKPEFQTFRAQLLEAVRVRDLKFLLDHVDPAITYSFGEEFGINGFITHWKLKEAPEKSRLWGQLDRLLRLGGMFTDEEQSFFIAPYTFVNFPTFIAASRFAVVVDERALVYADADPASRVIATVSHEVVKWKFQPGPYDPEALVKVVIHTGEPGFIKRKSIRSPIDYRAGFQNQNGVWKMMFLVSGD